MLPTGQRTMGRQTSVHYFLQITQSRFHDDGGKARWLMLVFAELFSLQPSGEKPGRMEPSWRREDLREELQFERSPDGGSKRRGQAGGFLRDGGAWAKEQEWSGRRREAAVLGSGLQPLAPAHASSVASVSSSYQNGTYSHYFRAPWQPTSHSSPSWRFPLVRGS